MANPTFNLPLPVGEVAPVYSNMVQLFFGPADMTLAFYHAAPQPNPTDPAVPIVTAVPAARVVVSPQQAKAILYIHRLNVARWEEQYGAIRVADDILAALGIEEEQP